MEQELEQLRAWYMEESQKIWLIPSLGLDGPREGMRRKLDEEFLHKRSEILMRYGEQS